MKKAITVIMIIILIFSYVSYSYALSEYGSRSDEVKLIQEKLKRWGYYTGEVNGVFGGDTLEAVKYFQKKNGLDVDGMADAKTLTAMGITSTSSGDTNSSAASVDVYQLAKLVCAEAGSEPYITQEAVASVVLNRMKNASFSNTLSGVIYQPGAFSSVDDGQINAAPNQTAMNAAQDALNGWDSSNGALYYFNIKKDKNGWMWSRPVTVTIDNYRFCK